MKHCVIISGHSRGLGAALTQGFLSQSWHVLGISRKKTDDHTRLAQVSLDLTNTSNLLQWLEGNTLDTWLADAQQAVLINNAGMVTPIATTGRADAAHLAQAIALNVSAALMLTDAFLKAASGCPDRRVAHISSGAARSAYAGWGTYCASKAALDHHARCMDVEIKAGLHAGLRVASIAPGVIDTDMQADVRGADAADFPSRQRFVDLKASGGLSSAASVAEKLQRYVCGSGFGSDVTPDLRSISI